MDTHYRSTTWTDPRLTIAESPIEGKGVFATAPVKKGETLMIFGGIVVDKKDLDETKHRLQSAFPVSRSTYIVLPASHTEESIDEYLNHSCDPSAWLTDEVTLVARKDIRPGDEITLDAVTWDTDEDWPYSEDGMCYCHSPLCRKVLRPNDYLNPILQKRYAGHFAPYVAALISGR